MGTADTYNDFRLRLAGNALQPTGPLPVRATWLANVERRLLGSIPESNLLGSILEGNVLGSIQTSSSEPIPNTGRWLEPETALQAINFFQATSDILPGEPYVYASRKGDLVAEFTVPKGKLTTIVSKTSFTSFSVVGDDIWSISFDLPVVNIQGARQKIREVSEKLR